MNTDEIIKKILNQERRAVARAITYVENNYPEAEVILDSIYPMTGNAYIVGVTGPPGAGKSTLVDKLTSQLRKDGRTVGIIAIDPTSPYTGGALLGDRIRMQQHCSDAGVFIRSMATRDALGGLAPTTYKVVKILDAAGFDVIIIETVGVGQAEVDIVNVAYTTLLLLVPGLGDDIQSFKAGIMEIADIFVINKADKPGKDRMIADLKMLLELNTETTWNPEIIETIATRNQGIEDLVESIRRHYRHCEKLNIFAKKERKNSELELIKLLSHTLTRRYLHPMNETDRYTELVNTVVERKISPYKAVELIIADFEKRLTK